MRYILEHTCSSAVQRMVKSSPSLHQSPSAAFWDEHDKHMREALTTALEGNMDVVCVTFDELQAELERMFFADGREIPESSVITTDRDLSHWRGYECFEVNRLVSAAPEKVLLANGRIDNLLSDGRCFGSIIGVGPRPGAHNLDKQLASIKEKTNGGPVTIIEDGSFSGETLEEILTRFHRAEIEVERVLLGFLFSEAHQRLCETGVRIDYWQGPTDLDGGAEWVLDQDFTPFIPGSGRVIGYALHGQIRPMYSLNRYHLCRPYILPYGNTPKWASIPTHRSVEFSMKCIELTRNIFKELEELNGLKIECRHLQNTYPKTGMPVSVLDNGFPEPEDRVVNLLGDSWRQLTALSTGCLHRS